MIKLTPETAGDIALRAFDQTKTCAGYHAALAEEFNAWLGQQAAAPGVEQMREALEFYAAAATWELKCDWIGEGRDKHFVHSHPGVDDKGAIARAALAVAPPPVPGRRSNADIAADMMKLADDLREITASSHFPDLVEEAARALSPPVRGGK